LILEEGLSKALRVQVIDSHGVCSNTEKIFSIERLLFLKGFLGQNTG